MSDNNQTDDYRDYCINRGMHDICMRDPFPVDGEIKLCKNINCSLSVRIIALMYNAKQKWVPKYWRKSFSEIYYGH